MKHLTIVELNILILRKQKHIKLQTNANNELSNINCQNIQNLRWRRSNSHCNKKCGYFGGCLRFSRGLGSRLRSGDAGGGRHGVGVRFTNSHPGETLLEFRPAVKRRRF